MSKNFGWSYEGEKQVPAITRQAAILMGFNPGAGKGGTTEKLSPGEKNWRTKAYNLVKGFCVQPAFSELIHIVSEKKLDAKYNRDDFVAAAEINRDIINYHKPDIIFQAGIHLPDLAIIAPLYQLKYIREISCSGARKGVLLRHYEIENGPTWISFKHFTGSYGYSNLDREDIRNYAREALSKKSLEPYPIKAPFNWAR